MGRRKKGRDVSGWVIVDKAAGIGSTTVVNMVRRAFDAKKAGHAGTLDPDATGLLAVALGEATKTIPFVTDALKSYEFTLAFGSSTSTDDASGEILETSDHRPDTDQIEAALAQFTGDIVQVPPRVSAVKVDGARAYDLAREGGDFDLKARPLHVSELSLLDRPDADHATLRMTCGKGGYVRSIARDLGVALGTLAHVVTLRRTWAGPFTLDDAVTLDALEAAEDVDALLQPLECSLTDMPMLTCGPEAAARLRNGNPGAVAGHLEYGETAWAAHNGRCIAIGTYRGGELHPSRVLNRD